MNGRFWILLGGILEMGNIGSDLRVAGGNASAAAAVEAA